MAIIYPWKRVWSFIWTHFNILHPKMFCAKFAWSWPSGSWEDENVKSLETERKDRWTNIWRTYNRQKVIRKCHSNFQLMWAKKSYGPDMNLQRQTDRWMDRQIDRQSDSYIPSWSSFMEGMIKMVSINKRSRLELVYNINLIKKNGIKNWIKIGSHLFKNYFPSSYPTFSLTNP